MTSFSTLNPARLRLRRVTTADAPAIIDIARTAGLDTNSPYIYGLWCHDFSEYTAVAADDDHVAGFIMCYPRPAQPDHLFIWQAGVLPAYRGRGLAGDLLHHVHTGRFTYVECTVTPSNSSSLQFLRKFADDLNAPLRVAPFLDDTVFGATGHEPEDLVSIGPISSDDHQPDTESK
ncbi:diaminobutyrate acetyltransferase [Gordonia sp. N1V]|uniref:diaminobutyrate acetyltransferase n=1 Tax=Gordonia sp. N1V TaxID=3034163 RepID=UPI0023E25232|nr:diaminobutyrate acetyltransferase [Gordonia sp. N1V]MDF3285489.1 diaminobutyrate acetyltransferase [Gordonia sp. N1V]